MAVQVRDAGESEGPVVTMRIGVEIDHWGKTKSINITPGESRANFRQVLNYENGVRTTLSGSEQWKSGVISTHE